MPSVASSVHAIMMVVMVVMVMMTMGPRSDADVNASAVMVVMVMMVTDHNLGGSRATAGAPFPPGDSVERSAPFECCARFERIRHLTEQLHFVGP